MFWSKQKPEVPPTVPGDTIIPLHLIDRTPEVGSVVLNFTWRFDDVLDIDKLSGALQRLVQLGHWNKLGARIHPRADGFLEWHLPAAYTVERPPFVWTRDQRHHILSQDPISGGLPDPMHSVDSGDIARIVGDHPSSFKAAVIPPYVPQKLEDWLYSDKPALHVHTTEFEDATLLTVSFPHELMDGVAAGVFLKAWTAILHGREDQVPPALDFRRDVVADALIGKAPKEQSVFFPAIMSGFQIIKFLVHLFWERFTHSTSGGLISIPDKHVKGLRRDAMGRLPLLPNGEKPVISESDVLMAWLGRAVARGMNSAPSKPFVFINVLDMRKTLAEEIPAGTAFVGNCVGVSTAPTTAAEVLGPLGPVAIGIRRALAVQRTREQLSAFYQIRWEAAEAKPSPGIPRIPMGRPAMTIIYWSNWLAAKLFELDFSPAVVKVGRTPDQRISRAGVASWMGSCLDSRVFGWDRNTGHLTGRDAAGNWWIQWHARKSIWPAIRRELAILSQGVYE